MRSPRPHGSGIVMRGVDTSHDEAVPPFRRAASEIDLAPPVEVPARLLTALSDGGGRYMQHVPVSMPSLVFAESGPKIPLPDDIDAVALVQPTLTNKVSDLLSSPELTLELVRVLELHGKVTSVALAFLLRDIQALASPATLFREDTIGTRLLAALSHLIASERFLFATVVPLVNSIRENAKLYVPDAARPLKDKCPQLQALRSLVSSFISNITSAIPECAVSLRYILHQIEDAVQRKFPGHSVLSSLFFLRFLCPAIVRCESFMHIESLSIDERRAMVLVTKILQAIANGVEMKEAHLASLNPFIAEKSALVKAMCSKLIDLPSLQIATLQQLEWRTSQDIFFNPVVSSELNDIVPTFCCTTDLATLHPVCWSVQHVLSWLEQVGLSDCSPAFQKYKIDGISLLLLPDRGFDEFKLPKSKRKQVLNAVQSLISERTRFFPAYKTPTKWSAEEVLDYLSFMDLGAFSFVLRSLSNKVPLPGSSMLFVRNDDLKILGVDGAADRVAILDRILDAVLVFYRLESARKGTARRTSSPSWLGIAKRSMSVCAESDTLPSSSTDADAE